MAERVYAILISGTITRDLYNQVNELMKAIETEQHIMGAITASDTELKIDLECNQVHIDDTGDLTDFLEDNYIAYDLRGYATVSDSYFLKQFRPSIGGTEWDTNEDYDVMMPAANVANAIQTLKESGKESVTLTELEQCFAQELNLPTELPDLCITE